MYIAQVCSCQACSIIPNPCGVMFRFTEGHSFVGMRICVALPDREGTLYSEPQHHDQVRGADHFSIHTTCQSKYTLHFLQQDNDVGSS